MELQGKALAVAESANLLMMPGRARDQDRWMQDAQLMLDAGRAAFRAAKAKDVAALDALNDQLYTSCTSCHQHYRPNYGRRPAAPPPSEPCVRTLPLLPSPAAPAPPAPPAPSAKPTLEGRWKLRKAEDLRADGTVARLPWGEHPVGSIVVERGACYVQIMSSDTPSFPAGAAPATEQMKATLLSSYIAYSGPCTINDAESSVTLKVDAAWRPELRGHGAEALLPVRERRAAVRPGAGIDPRRQRGAHAPADARPRPMTTKKKPPRSQRPQSKRFLCVLSVLRGYFRSVARAPRRMPVIA